MKINRMSEEKIAPSWAFEDVDNIAPSEFININSDEVERVFTLPTDDLTEDQIVEQREIIESRASEGLLYHYNSKWPEKVQSTLKEYASICGMDMSKFKSVHPEYIEEIRVVARGERGERGEKSMSRTASESELSDLSSDPFKLDTKGDMSHMDESDWQDIHKQQNLDFKPSMQGSVIPVRGGEDYNISNVLPTARGQNSIVEPDAIETFANSEEEDTGVRLRRENEERANAGEVRHQAWEQDKVEAMGDTSIVPKGIMPATGGDAQPGIRGEDAFGFDSLPEKTDGEMISEANEDRRKEIQGEDKEEHEFELQKNPARQISNTFGEELKKYLK
jgi:hypothetical protein